jgi:hypothetical protein
MARSKEEREKLRAELDAEENPEVEKIEEEIDDAPVGKVQKARMKEVIAGASEDTVHAAIELMRELLAELKGKAPPKSEEVKEEESADRRSFFDKTFNKIFGD